MKFGGRFFYLEKAVHFYWCGNTLLSKIVDQSVDDILTVSDELSYFEVNSLVDRNALQTTTRDHQVLEIKDKRFTNSERLRMRGRVYLKNGLALGILSYS